MTLVTLWFTTFAVCVVGSLIPLINTELYLLSVSALSPREFVVPLVVAATAGQMVGKVGMFYAGRGIVGLRDRKVRRRIIGLRARLRTRPHLAKLILFSSATLGLPPLYVMSIACGTIGMGVLSFAAIGAAGRLIHFTVVALLPQYAKLLIG